MIRVFYDGLYGYQDYDQQLPLIGKTGNILFDLETGDHLSLRCPTYQHEGSYSTKLNIRVSGNRLNITGNPSRLNRLDNLSGISSLDQCISVYNDVLKLYDLPPLTKNTKTLNTYSHDGKKMHTSGDGFTMTELHITSNWGVGQGCVDQYIRALSTQPYLHGIPNLKPNGKTVEWLSKSGEGPRLIYASVYNKAHEIGLHTSSKVKRRFGENSDEYKYIFDLQNYCESHGVARFEQKLKSEFLRRHRLCFYGLFDEHDFRPLHEEFLNLNSKLQVEAMNLETISARLVREGVCDNTKAANTTTLYAINWMHGHHFDFSKKAVQTHRARLRKIGIDIALPCDITKFSLINVVSTQSIEVKPLLLPDWYRKPKVNHLKIAA